MKKLLSCLLIIICCLCFKSGIKAGDTEATPVNFNLVDTFYTTIAKSRVNNRTYFDLNNYLNTMTLTTEQLKTILSYKANDPTSHLAIYETLNINVTPVAGTNYASLTGKDTYYLDSSDEHWEDKDDITLDMGDVATIHNLDSNYYPWGFRVVYRLNSDDDYIETPPADNSLDNKTIEQQLASILGIDLSANPNGVIDEYKNLYDFDTLNSDYTSTIRFDFFDKDPTKEPVKLTGNDSYNPASLKSLGTEYVVIRYNNSPTSSPTIGNIDKDKDSEASTWIFIIGGLAIIGGSVYYYLKKIRKVI